MGQSGLIAGLLLILAATAAVILWRRSTASNRRLKRRKLRRAKFEQREMIDMFGEERGAGAPSDQAADKPGLHNSSG